MNNQVKNIRLKTEYIPVGVYQGIASENTVEFKAHGITYIGDTDSEFGGSVPVDVIVKEDVRFVSKEPVNDPC